MRHIISYWDIMAYCGCYDIIMMAGLVVVCGMILDRRKGSKKERKGLVLVPRRRVNDRKGTNGKVWWLASHGNYFVSGVCVGVS